MKTKAIFHRNEPQFDLADCEIEKVITLPGGQFQEFQSNLLGRYDFLTANTDRMFRAGNVYHCLLVLDASSGCGILVESEGADSARCAAFFPGARQYLES